MQQAGITLQIDAQINRTVYYSLQVINSRFILTGTKIKCGNFIIEYKYAVPVNKQ